MQNSNNNPPSNYITGYHPTIYRYGSNQYLYYNSQGQINNNSKPTFAIQEDILKAIFKECKSDEICKNQFLNHDNKNIEFSIFKTNFNNVERYHLILNDKLNNKITHALTLKNTSNNNNPNLVIDNNYITKNIHYYNPILIPDNQSKNHAIYFYAVMNDEKIISEI